MYFILKKIVLALFFIAFCHLNCLGADYKVLNQDYLGKIKQAKSFESKGDISKANDYYKMAGVIFPTRFESCFGLAKTYGWLHNTKSANFYYNQLLASNPENNLVREQYAYFLRDNSYYKPAITQFEQLILKTYNTKYKYNIAEIYYNQGYYDKAIAYLQQLKDLNTTKLLANCYYNKADYKNAQIYFAQYLAVRQSDVEEIKYAKSLFYSGNPLASKLILEKYADNPDVSTTLADVYLSLGQFEKAKMLLENLLAKEPTNLEIKTKYAKTIMALGDIDRAKILFQEVVLKQNNNEALKGIAQIDYLKENYLSSIKTLKNTTKDEEANLLLAKNYNKLLKGSTAVEVLNGDSSAEANNLRAEIRRDNSFQIEPIFGFGRRDFDGNQYLNSKNYGFTASKTIFPDTKAYGRFEITPYNDKNTDKRGTVASYTVGSTGKIGLKTNYLGEVTLDNFSNGGNSILGKTLVDYKFNDKFKLQTGFLRSLVDETMTSTTGIIPYNGIETNARVGRVIDNKFIFDVSAKLPYNSYIYSGYHLGAKTGYNLDKNPYQEIMGGIGKLLYSKDENRLLNQIVSGYNIYYAGYKNNELNNGGYFSPDRIIVNNVSIKLRGSIKKLNLKYQNESFAGVQNIKESGSDFTWGNTICLIWNEQGRVGVKLGYNTNFYGVARRQNFFVQLLLKDFLRKQKCLESL